MATIATVVFKILNQLVSKPSSAHATSQSSQGSETVWAKASNNAVRQHRWPSCQLSPTRNSTKSVRPTAANALRQPMPLLPSRPRTEPSPLLDLSLSSRKFSSPRDKELPRTQSVAQRKTPCASLLTRTVVLVPLPSASSSSCALPILAHQSSPSMPDDRIENDDRDNFSLSLLSESILCTRTHSICYLLPKHIK